MTGRPSLTGTPHLLQVLPTPRAILWNPTAPSARRTPGGAYPLFIEQKAITALHEHFQATPQQAVLGFLVGDLFECPTSKVRYAVVDSTIRLNQPIYGDKTLVVISRLWDRIQDELARISGHLLGWYHSHPPIAVELAPGDVQTHEQYFRQPWQTGLVLGADREGNPHAGVFRPGPQPTWPTVSLPFYELIDDGAGLAGNRKRSVLPWVNFATDDPLAVHVDAPAQPAAASTSASPEPRSTIEVVGGEPVPQKSATTGQRVSSPSAPKPRSPTRPAQPAAPRANATAPRSAQTRPAEPPPSAPPPPAAPPMPPATPPPPRKSVAPPKHLAEMPLLHLGNDAGFGIHHPEAPPVEKVAPEPAPRPSEPRLSQPVPRPRPSIRGLRDLTEEEPASGSRLGWVLVVLLLLGGGVGAWYALGKPPLPFVGKRVAAAATATADTSLATFDRLIDSVGHIVKGYSDRAKLFENQQLDCTGLARGLTAVEDLWTTYNLDKSKVPALDALHAGLDRALYGGVDSVERHFDRSGCQRP